jgi:hypothetical protein
MKIVAIETHLIRVPCDLGAAPTAFVGVGWSSLDTLFVRVVTDQGLEGWGEGFGHACCPATRAVIDTQLAPAALGEDARDIRGLMARLAQRMHLFRPQRPARLCAVCPGCRALGYCWESGELAALAAAWRRPCRRAVRLCKPAPLQRPGRSRQGLRACTRPRL